MHYVYKFGTVSVNREGFVWKFLMRYIYIFINSSFIHLMSSTFITYIYD